MTSPPEQGFLLTRHWHDTPAGAEISLWLVTATGPVMLVYPAQELVFFLSVNQIEAARQHLTGADVRPLKLRNFKLEATVGCYFRSQSALLKARNALQHAGFEPLEADIKPCDRFLMERFVRGGVAIHSVGERGWRNGFACWQQVRISGTRWRPPLKVVSLDIETAMDRLAVYSIGLLASDCRKVMMVGTGANSELVEYFASELALLQAFLAWVSQYDPDIFIGWNIVGFDFWYLERCFRQHGIAFKLGRDNAPVYWRTLDDGSERRVMGIAGRVVLDGIDVLKTAGYRFQSYSLQSVAMAVLGTGKLLTGSQRGEEITDLYHADKESLAAYNIQDCQLVMDIFEQRGLLDFCISRSQLTGLPLDRIGGSVAAFDYQYLPLLHRQGFVAPAQGSVPPAASPGGYVLSSRPGLFKHVLVLDFKSLYPSIIRSFCIDPMGMALALGGEVSAPVPGFAGGVFSPDQHLLPTIIAELWQARDSAKRDRDSALSQAIKIIMNSFYGVLGTPGCRFFDPRLASSITLRGHQIITESRDYIEQQGYPVIYGDTDSLFVLVPKCDSSAMATSVGRELQAGLNVWWRQRLHEEMGLDSVLEIEFETNFEHFFMPTIRGGEEGSKKRYAGLIEKDGVPQVVFKGLENVRSDWTEMARDFQLELYTRIFTEQPWQGYLAEVVAALYSGSYDEQLIYRKRLRQNLDDYRKNVPPQVQAARKAISRGAAAANFRRGEWVEYVMTTSGPEPAAMPVARLDYDFYLERQLAPVADSILQFFGTSLEAQVAPQMGMF